jgi:hypothetical protein
MNGPSAPIGFRDPTQLTRILQFLLVALLVIDVVAFFSDIAQYQLLQSALTEDQANANDARQHVIGIAYIVVYALTAVTFGRWIYCANKNARALGAVGMQFSPGWSVGWYFIPILSLWKPYQAMKEIWQASSALEYWQGSAAAPILGWWWFAYVVSAILGQLYFRVSMAANDLSSLSSATVLGLANEAFDVATIALAWMLIAGLNRIQLARVSASAAVTMSRSS